MSTLTLSREDIVAIADCVVERMTKAPIQDKMLCATEACLYLGISRSSFDRKRFEKSVNARLLSPAITSPNRWSKSQLEKYKLASQGAALRAI
jgi:hypothetical protein